MGRLRSPSMGTCVTRPLGSNWASSPRSTRLVHTAPSVSSDPVGTEPDLVMSDEDLQSPLCSSYSWCPELPVLSPRWFERWVPRSESLHHRYLHRLDIPASAMIRRRMTRYPNDLSRIG